MEYVLILAAYLCGSIPFGLVIGKTLGVDIRKGGSGNIGATNVNRQLGKKYGILTLIGDAGKAVVPMMGTSALLAGVPGVERWVMLSGAAAFLGHLFPLYLRFHGGKGVATALGLFLYLTPMTALALVLVFAATVGVSGFVSLGSLLAAAAAPVIVWLLHRSLEKTLLALLIAILIWIKHAGNIGRLLRREEKSWKKSGADGIDDSGLEE